MSRRLGWCVVGCGWVARDYVIPAIRASGNGRLVAACDRSDAALSLLPGGCFRTTDVQAAVSAPGVDAVYVATPNHAHRPAVEAAAAAGKAVLCEKPMASTVADARAMLAACAAAGVRYATAYDQRFHAAHRQLARLVAAGRLGTVTQARIHYACWVPPDWAGDNWRADPLRAGGGAVIDLAPHGLDLLELVLGDEWAELVCFTQRRVHDYPVDDGGVLVGRMRSGTLCSLHVGYNCPETFPRRTLEVIGTAGRAVCVNTMGQTPGGTLTVTDAATGQEAGVPLDDDRSPFLGQVEAFAAAVLAGAAYPYPGARDLGLHELLDEALAGGGRDLTPRPPLRSGEGEQAG